jgi:Na+-driven multidrug efflux pump
MLSIEFWSFEILTLMSGYLSLEETGANVITLNTTYFTFMFVLGLMYAGTAIIGQQIGHKNIPEAKRYAKII